jgi:hypothetical protein
MGRQILYSPTLNRTYIAVIYMSPSEQTVDIGEACLPCSMIDFSTSKSTDIIVLLLSESEKFQILYRAQGRTTSTRYCVKILQVSLL